MEYIVRREIQRSLKRFFLRTWDGGQGNIGNALRIRGRRRVGRGGRSRNRKGEEENTLYDEMRLLSSVAYYGDGENTSVQGRPKGSALRNEAGV